MLLFYPGNRVVLLGSKKQDIITQSTCEAEYVVVAATTNQGPWIRKVLSDFGKEQVNLAVSYFDHQPAVEITDNQVNHGKMKHIKIKYHVVREAKSNNQIYITHCDGNAQLVDIFTKLVS